MPGADVCAMEDEMAKQTNLSPTIHPALDPEMLLETTIASRDPAGKTIQCRLGDFPPNAIEKFLRYGFQRTFNDATGGSDTTVEKKIAEAEAMIERFKAGEIGRAASTSVDAVTSLARSMVRTKLKTKNPEGAKRLRDAIKAGGAERDAAWLKIDAILERNPQIRVDATAELKRRAESVATVDVGDLEL